MQKELAKQLKKEIKRLEKLDNLTSSGSRKRLAIPRLKQKLQEVEKNFSKSKNELQAILDSTESLQSYEKKIIMDYCGTVYSPTNNLHEIAFFNGVETTSFNFKTRLIKIWLKEIE